MTFGRLDTGLLFSPLAVSTVSVHGRPLLPAEENSIVYYSAVLVALPSKENFLLVSSVSGLFHVESG